MRLSKPGHRVGERGLRRRTPLLAGCPRPRGRHRETSGRSATAWAPARHRHWKSFIASWIRQAIRVYSARAASRCSEGRASSCVFGLGMVKFAAPVAIRERVANLCRSVRVDRGYCKPHPRRGEARAVRWVLFPRQGRFAGSPRTAVQMDTGNRLLAGDGRGPATRFPACSPGNTTAMNRNSTEGSRNYYTPNNITPKTKIRPACVPRRLPLDEA